MVNHQSNLPPTTEDQSLRVAHRSMRRFRHRRRWVWIGAVTILVALGYADHRGWLLARGIDDLSVYHGVRATVDRVVDGDTLDLNISDPLTGQPLTRVCLWGVNCPEIGRFGKPSDPLAEDALQMTQSLVNGQTIMLRLESQRLRDSFGRVLAHIELSDGRSLNEELLRAGLARTDDRWPHIMLTRYGQVEYSAKRQGAGIWPRK